MSGCFNRRTICEYSMKAGSDRFGGMQLTTTGGAGHAPERVAVFTLTVDALESRATIHQSWVTMTRRRMIPTSKALLNMAVMAAIENAVSMRGIKLREAIPSLGFEDTRDIYAVVDPLLKRALELAHGVGAELTPAKALEILGTEYPDLERPVMERLMKHMYIGC